MCNLNVCIQLHFLLLIIKYMLLIKWLLNIQFPAKLTTLSVFWQKKKSHHNKTLKLHTSSTTKPKIRPCCFYKWKSHLDQNRCQNKPPVKEENGTDTPKPTKISQSWAALRQTESKWHGQLLCYIYLPITRTVPLGGSCQYCECRAWKVCLIRGCVKQCCCGTPPGAAESFTADCCSLGLWFTTSGVNWRDKPSSIQALTPPAV